MIDGDQVFVAEFYEGGKLVKRTANGVELPLNALEKEFPVFVQRTVVMSKEEFAYRFPEKANDIDV